MTERVDVPAGAGAPTVGVHVATQALTSAGATGTRTITLATSSTAGRVGFVVRPAPAVQSYGFDAINRHVSTTRAGTTVVWGRDLTDRPIARTVAGVTDRYGYTGAGDVGAATINTAGTVIERAISLPGGVLVTKRAGGDVWSYPNLHGDITVTTNPAGTVTQTGVGYDPYGNPTSNVDNQNGNVDHGWLGQHKRLTDHQTGITPTIQMGARPYHPTLGRFLTIDPIEGGSCNDYDYTCQDPTNNLDLDGRRCYRFNADAKRVASWTREDLPAGVFGYEIPAYRVTLRCGDGGSGLRHLRKHVREIQTSLRRRGIDYTETDFIRAMGQVVRWGEAHWQEQFGTIAFSAYMCFFTVDHRGTVVQSYNALLTVTVSPETQSVVTAFYGKVRLGC
jgi:RHS repeat-associated protein